MDIEEHKDKLWLHSKWRPAMGWVYMITCIFDFFLAPIAWVMFQSAMGADISTIRMWSPITLMGGGLYHVSMLAIVGVTAYGRTQEKLKRWSNEKPTPVALNEETLRAG